VDSLTTFNASTSNGSTLATVHIATAFSPALLKTSEDLNKEFPKRWYTRWYNDIGVDISASTPVQTATLPQYGKHALLTLDGGLVNVYGAFAGRDLLQGTFKPLDDGQDNPRLNNWDRIYLVDSETPEIILGYLKQGIGIRAVKTALTGTGMGGLGTFYLGGGFDGPLLSSRDRFSKDPNAGWFSIDAYGTANAINRSTLKLLFGETASRNGFFTVGAKAKIGLPGKFFLSAEYARALDKFGKAHIGNVSVVSFGYNNEEPAKK
jgi:hypothetical protein